jgi:hypothetical protein
VECLEARSFVGRNRGFIQLRLMGLHLKQHHTQSQQIGRPMTSLTRDLAARYDRAVERESAAWQALQLQKPGSPDRAEAWQAWAQAISHTNAAWRQLNRKDLYAAQPPHDISSVNL